MHYVLDILQGAGLALACGVNPFLPVLLAGALASADLGLDFDGTAFAFLENPWFLLAVAAGLVASVLMRARFETPRGQAALGGLGIGLGALVCAAAVDDRSDDWWPALPVGLACAALGAAVTTQILVRTRRRLDPQAQAALPLYAGGFSLLEGGLAVLLPPISIVSVGLFAWLAAGRRRREGQKYAGLRILR